MQERDVFSSNKRSKRRNEKSTISQDLQMLVNEGSMTKIQAERIMNDRTTTTSDGGKDAHQASSSVAAAQDAVHFFSSEGRASLRL